MNQVNLVIDIGNTAAKIAVFDNTELVETFYESNQSLYKLQEIANRYPLQKGIVASVITLTNDIQEQLKTLGIEILHVGADTPTPIINLYKTPKTLGVDRLAAMVAANYLYPQRDILVIDAGTCITYDFVDSKGCYRGGNISPGICMRLKAMHEFTGKLPLVSPKGETPTWGDTTETAIRSGVIHGVRMEVATYIQQTEEKYPSLFVILTGGDGYSFDTNEKTNILTDRHLVLKGLNRILNYNDTLS